MEHSHLRKGLSGVIIVFLATTLGNLAGYFARIILAHNITPSEIGLFYSVYALVMFIMLFVNFGTTSALTKYIAEFKAKKKYKALYFSIKGVSLFKLVTTLIATVILFLLSDFLAKYYFKSMLASSVIEIFAVTLFFIVLVGNLGAIFQGFQSNMLLALTLFSENFFFLVFLFLIILFNLPKDHLFPSYALLLGWITTSIIFAPFVIKYKNFFKNGKIDKKEITKKITIFSIASFMISLGNLTLGYISTAILTYFRPLSEVGIYNVVLPTVIVVGFLSRSIAQVFFPMVSELWAKNLKQKLIDGIDLLHKYALVTVIPLAMLLFVFPKELLNFIFIHCERVSFQDK